MGKIFRNIFFGLLVMLVVVEFFIHFLSVNKHAYFSWEELPVFYPVFGFFTCIIAVLFCRYVLRPLLRREEDHYD